MSAILGNRIKTVDALRGIASLAVCLFHLTNGNKEFLPNGALKSFGSLGWLGVDIFFVISGFILPYAMHHAEYGIKQFGIFLVKRIIRLDPPYLATIIFIIIAGYVTAIIPSFQGPPFRPSLPQVILHFSYLNAFFGYDWLNPVFWTLAIEFQFYFLVGILFPMIAHRQSLIRVGLFASLVALAVLLPEERFVFHWLLLFMQGMVAFQFRASLINKKGYFILLMALAVGTWHMLGLMVMITGIATATVIAFMAICNKVLLFLGRISYSLYLIHIPIGMKVINLGLRFTKDFPSRIVILIIALFLSLTAAYALYSVVEHAAQRWASSIKYRPAEPKKAMIIQEA